MMEHYFLGAHCFADDTQRCLSFKPLESTAQVDAIQGMECINAVNEILLVGTRQQLDKLDLCAITVGNNRVSPSPCVKNLGPRFDSNIY